MEHHLPPHKLPKSSSSSRSHSRSPSKVRSSSKESKRKISSSHHHQKEGKISPKAPLPRPPPPPAQAPYGSSYSWDAAQGQAFMERIALRTQSAFSLPERIDGSPKQSKDSPYLALVQLFNQFQGMPIDTKKVLVNVSVLGSTGPLRMLVLSDATVNEVIKMALLKYAHEGRVPALGRSTPDFELYASQYSSQALKHDDPIANLGTRNFVLCPATLTSSSCGRESKTSSTTSSKSWWTAINFFV